MLQQLVIKNFALVEQLELDFSSGMTVLTGETGAGKSILLDALGLVLGDRADSSTVRSGQGRADISARFDIAEQAPVRQWLLEHDLEQGEECILRRTISADGGSRGYINGQPAPVQSLRELGEQLVDIHGQHAHQSLLKRDAQRQLLDDFAGHDTLLADTRVAYQHWQKLQRELEKLTLATGERDFRLELLRYQVNELEMSGLTTSELQTLDEEHARLANASRLQQAVHSALEQLYENDDFAMVTRLGRLVHEMQELQNLDKNLMPITTLLEEAGIRVREATSELRHYLDRIDMDPERLQWIEQRQATLHELARKHRCQAAELPAILLDLQQELATLENVGERHDELKSALAASRSRYLKLAGKLSSSRAKATTELARQVTSNMAELGMRDGQFRITLESLHEDELSANGFERVEFLVSTNPGQTPRPLAKVASGGELSRISLAIQVITADKEGIPTLIFDEIDVGVGGGVAEMVGRRLNHLATKRQVLCVTHQPQVAAQGKQHVLVIKGVRDGATYTGVKKLDDKARVEEIARMLGGLTITGQTLSHAQEMLQMAHVVKD